MLQLVDTSVLIEAFRAHGNARARARVDALLAARQLATWEVVIAEMLHGARDEREYQDLLDDLGSQRVLAPPPDVWQRAARLGFDLRRQGVTVPLIDLSIAVVAMHNEVTLVHMDKDFLAIAEVCDLEQEYVSPTDPD
jgi:predicted nucleic acid-binding protein